MENIFRISLFALLFSNTSCTAISQWILSNPMSFSEIQRTGGIKISNVEKNTDDTVRIGVECDVSGLHTITRKPETLNSGLCVYKVKASVRDKDIYLFAVKSLAGRKYKSTCDGVTLKNLSSGPYRVSYQDPDGKLNFLTNIEIP